MALVNGSPASAASRAPSEFTSLSRSVSTKLRATMMRVAARQALVDKVIRATLQCLVHLCAETTSPNFGRFSRDELPVEPSCPSGMDLFFN